MKLDLLRHHLRERKLLTSGNKKTLMARLAAHLTERDASSDRSPPESDEQESQPTTPESQRSRSRQRDRRHRQRHSTSNDRSPSDPRAHRHSQRSSYQRKRDRQRGRHRSYSRSRSPFSPPKKGRQRAPHRNDSGSRRRQHTRSSSSNSSTDSESTSSTPPRRRTQRRHQHKGYSKHKRRRHGRTNNSSSSSIDDYDTTATSSSSSDSGSSTSSSHRTRRKRHRGKAKRLRSRTKAKLDKLTVPCCPPLARKYSSRIARGEYVSFDKLTIPSKKQRSDMHAKHSPKHAPRRPVTGLTTWIEAWNRFMGVRVATKPSKALELIKYQTLITTAFQDYPPEACIQYDRRFRQLAAKNKELAWDKYKEDLFVWCFSPKPASTGSFRANKPAVLSRLGPPPGTATHTATGAEICIRYNLPRGCTMDGCRYKHVCSKRGCEGDHPATRCPSKHQPS